MTFTLRKKLAVVWVLLSLLILSMLPLTASGSEKIRVEATGYAPIQANQSTMKEAALKDAFRSALEKALGVRITATTVMENLTISKDVVISQTWGHILSYTIIKEWEANGNYYVTVSAEVSSDTRWWAEFEGMIDVIRLHVKDLILKRTLNAPGLILPGSVYNDQALIMPIKSDKYQLIAIHSDSHQILWKRDLPDKLVAPLVSSGEWIIAVTHDKMLAIHAHYGWVKWTAKLDEPVLQKPVIDDDVIYVTTQKGRLLAFGIGKGNLLWQYASQSFFLTAPSIAGARIYFADGYGFVHAVDINRQSRTFKQLVNPKLSTAPTASPIATYTSFYDNADRVVAINSTDGSTVWEFTGKVGAAATMTMPPHLAQGKLFTVFTQSKESRMYLLDARSGHLLWEQKMNLVVTEVTGIGNGVIILNTWGGIRILDLEHGGLLWETAGATLEAQLVSGEDQLFYLHEKVIDIYQ